MGSKAQVKELALDLRRDSCFITMYEQKRTLVDLCPVSES